MQLKENILFCPCCGFLKQEKPINLCTSFKEVNNIGVSTWLYFETVKNLGLLLFVGFIVYGIYAIVTNVIASNKYRAAFDDSELEQDEKSYVGVLTISLGSKPLHNTE